MARVLYARMSCLVEFGRSGDVFFQMSEIEISHDQSIALVIIALTMRDTLLVRYRVLSDRSLPS